jgi:aminoacylase
MKAGHTKDCGETFQMNLIPRTATIGFDIRVTPHVPVAQVEAIINEWIKEEGVSLKWIQYTKEHFVTDLKNDHVVTFLDALKSINATYITTIFPAATDARFVRGKNIPVIGFSPMIHTPVLLHDHNEYLNANIYLKGIEIYEKIIIALTK